MSILEAQSTLPCQSRSNDGTVNGPLLAEYKLDGLNAGGYTHVTKTLKAFTPKKRKSYYICLVLAEYKHSGYLVNVGRNIPGTTALGNGQLGSVS